MDDAARAGMHGSPGYHNVMYARDVALGARVVCLLTSPASAAMPRLPRFIVNRAGLLLHDVHRRV